MMRKIIFISLFFSCFIVFGKKFSSYKTPAKIELNKVEVKRDRDSIYLNFLVSGFKKIDSIVIQIFENKTLIYSSRLNFNYLSTYKCDTVFSFNKPKRNTKLTLLIRAGGTYLDPAKSYIMSDNEADDLADQIYNANGGMFNDDEEAVENVARSIDDSDDLKRVQRAFLKKYNENLDNYLSSFLSDKEKSKYWSKVYYLQAPSSYKEEYIYDTISFSSNEFISESILNIAHLNYREAITVLILVFLLGIFLIPAISLDENKMTINRAFRYFLLLAPFFLALAISINIYSGFTTYESNTWRIVKMLFFFICSGVAAYYVYTNLFTDQKSVTS